MSRLTVHPVMSDPTGSLQIVAPKRAWLMPDFKYHIMLPWYDRVGPVSLRDGVRVSDRLPPGHYRLAGVLSGDLRVETTFEVQEDAITTLALGDGLGLRQRMALKTGADIPTLFLQRQRAQEAHFWVGHCDSDQRLGALLSEAAFFALDEDQQDEAAISEFGETQNNAWYDHDFMEAGWEDSGDTLAKRFAAYSYSEVWADALQRRADEAGITNPNCFIMHGGDPARPRDWNINSPGDVDRPGVRLRYLGKLSFLIY
ncbi:MAG: hypothetical protein AB8B82_17065 [Roseovarius sp.]